MYTNSYILRVRVCTGRAQIASHDVPESLPPPSKAQQQKGYNQGSAYTVYSNRLHLLHAKSKWHIM